MQGDYDAVMPAPFPGDYGGLGIRVYHDQLSCIDFLAAPVVVLSPRSRVAEEAVRQLEHYFADPEWRFDLPLFLAGTPFQRRVWSVLRTIRPGMPRSYGAVAALLDSSARAVGGACRSNPIPVVIPCHRVIAVGGIGGFSGSRDGGQLRIKEWLLAHERRA